MHLDLARRLHSISTASIADSEIQTLELPATGMAAYPLYHEGQRQTSMATETSLV